MSDFMKNLGLLILLLTIVFGWAYLGSSKKDDSQKERYEANAQIGREMLAKEKAKENSVVVVRGEISQMKFTIKAQFGSNRYEAMCHDINEECVLYSNTELPLYKPFQSYTVEKMGRLEYTMNTVNQNNGASWSQSVMRMTYRVQ